MTGYRALLFDMDGLMVDTERLYWKSEYELAGQAGKELSVDTIHKMMGRKPLESMKIFCQDLGLEGDPSHWLRIRDGLMLQLIKEELSALPGLFDILECFKDKLAMAVVTGNHQEFLDLVVDKLSIRPYFQVLLSSDTISQGKPHPECYLHACKILQLDAQQCIVLEDTENGCRSAQAAGCHTIAIPSEYTRGQDFSAAHKVCSDLAQARKYISGLLRNE